MGLKNLVTGLAEGSDALYYDEHSQSYYQKPSHPTSLLERVSSMFAIIDIRKLLGLYDWVIEGAGDVGAELAQGLRNTLALGTLVLALGASINFQHKNRDDLKKLAANLLRYLVADSNYNFLYTFRLNPHRMQVNRKKLLAVQEYGHGKYDLQHFGEGLITTDLSVSTGTMTPPPEILNYGIDDPRVSSAYLKFKEFEKFQESCRQKMLFVLAGEVYLGYFNGMTYTKEFEHMPREIIFNVSITLQPKVKFFVGDILGTWKEFFANRDLMWGDFLHAKDTLTHTSSQSYRGSINAALAGNENTTDDDFKSFDTPLTP